ncbi:MAG: alkaline phosphatase family protein [archaeon]|jgi:2,3-bisphosphoglycerate-independent phosphoglycerate mutase|nr:alkaline phosphatase family protein [archaeon]
MKGVLVVIDGVADEPCSVLGGKTPLQAAKTPNLDEIARKSKIEHSFVIKEGIAPESSSAVVSLLGYNPNYAPRGPLEARGLNVKLKNGDLVFRCNFGTIDDLQNLNIIDRRAGRTLSTEEAIILARAVNNEVKLPHGHKFELIPGVQHRAVLVIRGGHSANISNIDPAYSNAGHATGFLGGKFSFSKPLDDEEDSRLAADLVNSFARQAFEILNKHPLNIARAKKGLYSANFVFCRGAGNEPSKFKKLKGKWLCLGYMPLEIGIAYAAGMEVYKFKYPAMKGIDVYGNLYDGLKRAAKYAKRMLFWKKRRYDYFYIHFKETDVPGHDGKPHDKVKMLEILDSAFFSYLKKLIKKNDVKVVITPDHTTSCRKSAHASNPVPVLIYPSGKDKEEEKRFTEEEGLKGRRISWMNLVENNLLK